MASLTPENIRARKIALWVCSILGLIFILVLTNKAGASTHLSEARNPIAIIFMLMLFAGIMHAPRKDLRIPAIALSTVSIVTLLILLLTTGHS